MNKIVKTNMVILLSSKLISLLGTGIQMIAVPLYILKTTGSGTIMGLFEVAAILATLVISPVTGLIGDKYNKKYILIISDLGNGLIILLLAASVRLNYCTIAVLLAAQALSTVFSSAYIAASSSIFPEIFETDSLSKINAYKNGINSFALIAGPVLGGVIYGIWGISTVFILNSASFLVSAVLQVLLSYEKKTCSITEKVSYRAIYLRTKEVLKYINKNQSLKNLITFATTVNMIDTPVIQVVIPYLMIKSIGFSSQQYGFIQAFYIAGFLAGNLLFGFFLAKKETGKLFRRSVISQYVCTMVFSLVTLPLIMGLLGNVGLKSMAAISFLLLSIGTFNSISNTIIETDFQKKVDMGMQSRFFSITNVLFQISTPVGLFTAGTALDLVPSGYVLVSLSLILLVIVGWYFITLKNKAEVKITLSLQESGNSF